MGFTNACSALKTAKNVNVCQGYKTNATCSAATVSSGALKVRGACTWTFNGDTNVMVDGEWKALFVCLPTTPVWVIQTEFLNGINKHRTATGLKPCIKFLHLSSGSTSSTYTKSVWNTCMTRLQATMYVLQNNPVNQLYNEFYEGYGLPQPSLGNMFHLKHACEWWSSYDVTLCVHDVYNLVSLVVSSYYVKQVFPTSSAYGMSSIRQIINPGLIIGCVQYWLEQLKVCPSMFPDVPKTGKSNYCGAQRYPYSPGTLPQSSVPQIGYQEPNTDMNGNYIRL